MFSYPCPAGTFSVIVSSKFKSVFVTKLNKLKSNIQKLVDKSAAQSKAIKYSKNIFDIKSSNEKHSIEDLTLKRTKKVLAFLKSKKLQMPSKKLEEQKTDEISKNPDENQSKVEKLRKLVISILDRDKKASLNYAQKYLIIWHFLKSKNIAEISFTYELKPAYVKRLVKNQAKIRAEYK